MLDKAITFAAAAHKDAKRKGLSQPYIFHPLEVLSLVSLMSDDQETLCAAVLHDTVEDTDVASEDIRREFSDKVAALVGSETEDKRGQVNKEGTWAIRKQETIDRICAIDDLSAKMICLADKVSNLRSLHMMKLEYGDETFNFFNQKDPKMHYWYYSELAKALKDLEDQVVYKEYMFLIDAVFAEYL